MWGSDRTGAGCARWLVGCLSQQRCRGDATNVGAVGVAMPAKGLRLALSWPARGGSAGTPRGPVYTGYGRSRLISSSRHPSIVPCQVGEPSRSLPGILFSHTRTWSCPREARTRPVHLGVTAL